MENILFPNWIVFSAFFIFFKIYNPTRLFLDNTSIIALSIYLAILFDFQGNQPDSEIIWVISVVSFAFFVSIPYWLGSMLGSILQQLLLLNEQSVQDKRFTEESEALARISGLLFVMYALDDGLLFLPLVKIFNNDLIISIAEYGSNYFEKIYFIIVEYMKIAALISSKYMIAIISISVCVAMVDLFFKKASLSSFLSSDLKAILLIILLNTWFFSDQIYLFKNMTEGLQ
ncbi:type III secretion system apparatus protein VscT2 [Providencia rettgeri]|uniref:type III secretion system apparatus protein VscT2 n=1 Tax=Providencia rettgeri TaxID=587 RepID=UPI000D7D6051|nr:type III secretion system apparatus protein VscT2 [Providencia rettgeri]